MNIVAYSFLTMLVLCSSVARSDSITGTVRIWANGATEPSLPNTFMVALNSGTASVSSGTSCFYGLITGALTTDGGKGMYATLLAAVSANKPVTVIFSSTPGVYTGCTATQVNLQ